MSLNITALTDAMESFHASTGLFRTGFGMHEPPTAPGRSLSGACWAQEWRTVPARSGLNTTSYRIAFFVRLFLPSLMEPKDELDRELLQASDTLCEHYCGDFTLGGTVSYVDLMGAHGIPLSGTAGYLDQDGKHFRVFTLIVPLVVDDAHTQEA